MPVVNLIKTIAVTNIMNMLLLLLIVIYVMEDKFNDKK